MKNISEHLGQIIVALAGVALLITAIVLFSAPIGGFFNNITDKLTDVGGSVLEQMDVAIGEDNTGSGEEGGSETPQPTPEPPATEPEQPTGITEEDFIGEFVDTTGTYTLIFEKDFGTLTDGNKLVTFDWELYPDDEIFLIDFYQIAGDEEIAWILSGHPTLEVSDPTVLDFGLMHVFHKK